MRCFSTVNVVQARAILRDGWTDRYEEFGRQGVFFSTRPLDANDGFDGNVTLCLEVPEDTFTQFDVTDDLQAQSGYRLALIPAADANRLAKPQVYDHFFAGLSRRELVESIAQWEQYPSANQHADEMREAMLFFDEIGWQAPLKLKESNQQ